MKSFVLKNVKIQQFIWVKLLYICMKLLLRMGQIGTSEEFVQQAYKKFSTYCLNSRVDVIMARQDFKDVGDLFVKTNELESFCDKTIELSRELRENGNLRLSDILINELSKLCLSFSNYNRAEELLLVAIRNCQNKNDSLHELARLIDLEKLYKETNNRKALFQILGMKKACCKKILNNYEDSVSNYDSILKNPTSKKSVEIQLAFTYSALAEMLERRKPEDALRMYQKVREIYQAIKCPKEVEFYDKKINWLLKKINKK